MIGHEHIGVNLPAGLRATLRQRPDETLPIRVIVKNQLPPVTAVQDVVNRARILHSQLASHASSLTGQQQLSITRTDPVPGSGCIPVFRDLFLIPSLGNV